MGLSKEELRIGNLVLFNLGTWYIKAITANLADLGRSDGTSKLVWISELKPMPITEDLLVRMFGFEKVIDNEYLDGYKTRKGFWISQSKIDDDPIQKAGSWYVGEGWTRLEYIHELQNYYYWVNNFKKELGSNG